MPAERGPREAAETAEDGGRERLQHERGHGRRAQECRRNDQQCGRDAQDRGHDPGEDMHGPQVQATDLGRERISRHRPERNPEPGAVDHQEQARYDDEGRRDDGQVVGGDPLAEQRDAPAWNRQVHADDVGAEQQLDRALGDQPDPQRRDGAGQVGLEDDGRDDRIGQRGERHDDHQRERDGRAPGQVQQRARGKAIDQERRQACNIAVREVHDAGALEDHHQAEGAQCIEASRDQSGPGQRKQVPAHRDQCGEHAHSFTCWPAGIPPSSISSMTAGK